jgi:hypothetical protein
MEQAQFALNLQTAQPPDSLLQAIGEGIGNNAAHEVAHQLVTQNGNSGKIVAGMGLHDGSTDTYNGGNCSDPAVFTGVQNGVAIHWGNAAVQSLTNLFGSGH